MNLQAFQTPFELIWGDLQSLTMMPNRLTEINSWHGHIPFAFWLVKKLEPSIFVEFGVHKGDSYSAFCQAVQTFSYPTLCYGIDAWQRDDNASLHDKVNYDEYCRFHNEQYTGFSRLIETNFNDAPLFFQDGTIDLLSIVDQPRYEDVKDSFKSWLPKLSDRAIVLFHDTNARAQASSGLWQFFLELSQQYSGRSFSFLHCNGLGILIVGGQAPVALRNLGGLRGEDVEFVRLSFSTFGKLVEARATELMLRSELKRLNLALQESVLDVQKSEKLRLESAIELIKAGENERRKIEIESYKAELKLSSLWQDALKELHSLRKQYDDVCQENEVLIKSRSMRITKPLRDLLLFANRFRY